METRSTATTMRKVGIMNTGRGKGLMLGQIGALTGAILLLVVIGTPAAVGAQEAAAICTFPFYAQIFQGQDTGMVLHGNVALSIEPSGHAFGILSEEDGTQVGFVGQVTGRTLSLLLAVEGGHLSGVGIADSDVRACGFTTIFGPLVGPAIDDSGSWGVVPPCLPYPACRGLAQ